MRFRQLALACKCGFTPLRFDAVGFTSEYELVVHWKCRACGKLAYAVKPLADCCRECPETEVSAAVASPAGNSLYHPEDARFLHTLGIRFPDDIDR